jgi:predicted O-methyltransferase YrrM
MLFSIAEKAGHRLRRYGVASMAGRARHHLRGSIGGWREVRRHREFATLDELIDYTDTAVDGYFKPLQVRGEIRALLGLVRELRPRRVMEIGTAGGGTLLMWTRVAAGDARLISLDLPGGPWGGGYGAWKVPVYKAFALPGQRVELVRADSHQPSSLERVRALLGGEALDFLMIDGDHSYEGVKQDYEMYSPLVRAGGLIAFHDVADAKDQYDVARLWRDVRARHPEHYEFIDDPNQGWGGIGVVRKI